MTTTIPAITPTENDQVTPLDILTLLFDTDMDTNYPVNDALSRMCNQPVTISMMEEAVNGVIPQIAACILQGCDINKQNYDRSKALKPGRNIPKHPYRPDWDDEFAFAVTFGDSGNPLDFKLTLTPCESPSSLECGQQLMALCALVYQNCTSARKGWQLLQAGWASKLLPPIYYSYMEYLVRKGKMYDDRSDVTLDTRFSGRYFVGINNGENIIQQSVRPLSRFESSIPAYFQVPYERDIILGLPYVADPRVQYIPVFSREAVVSVKRLPSVPSSMPDVRNILDFNCDVSLSDWIATKADTLANLPPDRQYVFQLWCQTAVSEFHSELTSTLYTMYAE